MTGFGAVTGEPLQEGLYVKVPFIDSVKKMDVKTQKYEVEAGAASRDLQTVSSKVALNFHVDPTKVNNIYQRIGKDYQERIIVPAVQESVKASTAKFTAEELITKRESVREEIKIVLMTKLNDEGIVVDEFNIVDFDFSKSFNDAIEAKVTAEQNALASKNKLEQIKYEAQQAVESAKGRAEAQKIEGQALLNNPQVLELRAIERWNGILPVYMTGTVPFVNIGN
jgi:regulator of protease activity HflC (stomatin/prohibitin superfamily)